MNNTWQRHWIMVGAGCIALALLVFSGLWPGPERQAVALENQTVDATDERIRSSVLLPFSDRQAERKPHLKHQDQKQQHVAVSFASATVTTFQTPALRAETLIHDGITRTFGVYAPATLDDRPALVFVLHGGGGSMETTWDQEFGQTWRRLADEKGLVLILPEGRLDAGATDDHHWNDCRTGVLNPLVNTPFDDVGFLSALIDLTDERFGIDLNRVYVTGASNGGLMSYRAAQELGERIAAVGAVIANLPDPGECGAPRTPVSVLIINGTEDPLMPFNGGCVANNSCRRGRVASTEETVLFWTAHNQTDPEPTVEALPNASLADRSTVTRFTYANGVGGNEVVLYRVEGGGHTVPGFGPDAPARRAVVGPKNRDFSGPEATWAFFERHSK